MTSIDKIRSRGMGVSLADTDCDPIQQATSVLIRSSVESVLRVGLKAAQKDWEKEFRRANLLAQENAQLRRELRAVVICCLLGIALAVLLSLWWNA